MTNANAQLILQTWMSAAFPIGSFTYSHGLESAIANQQLHNASTVEQWISLIIEYGSGWNDAVLLVSAYNTIRNNNSDNASPYPLKHINDLALGLSTGAERLKETTQLGHAFAKAACCTVQISDVTEYVDGDIALPVAIGACGALANIELELLLPASMHASGSNLVWISTRLVPLGQSQALGIIANLQTLVTRCAAKAVTSTLDDLGSCALLPDLASIEHETLHSRICIT